MTSMSSGVIQMPAHVAVDVAVALTGLTHRWRVDDGHQLGQVFDQHAVEEHLVSILKGRQPDVLLERVRLGGGTLHLEIDLLFDIADPRRQQRVQPEPIALLLREAEALVGRRVLQQPEAPLARHDAVRPADHPRPLHACHCFTPPCRTVIRRHVALTLSIGRGPSPVAYRPAPTPSVASLITMALNQSPRDGRYASMDAPSQPVLEVTQVSRQQNARSGPPRAAAASGTHLERVSLPHLTRPPRHLGVRENSMVGSSERPSRKF